MCFCKCQLTAVHTRRPESFDQKGYMYSLPESGGQFPVRKSQDAAVGALVRMLKKAPPLRQDISKSNTLLQASKTNTTQETNEISEASAAQHAAASSIVSSALLAMKTTSDALEELQAYRDMKNLLLSQSDRSYILAKTACAAEPSSSKITEHASAAEPFISEMTGHSSAAEPSSSNVKDL